MADLERAQSIGIEQYNLEQREKFLLCGSQFIRAFRDTGSDKANRLQ